MGVFILDDSLSDFAGEGVSDRDIDVISRDSECLDQQGLNKQTGNHLPFFQSRLEIPMKGGKKLMGKGHISHNTKVFCTSGEALHVLHFHLCQPGKFLSLIRDQRA